MELKYYFKQGMGLMKLNSDIAEEISQDMNAFGPAVLFFAIGGLAASSAMFIRGGIISIIVGAIIGPVFSVVSSFIGVGILYLLVKLFGGKGGFKGYYKALGIGSLPIWAGIIPHIIGYYISFYSIPIAVVVTNRVHNLSRAKAQIIWIFVTLLYFFYLQYSDIVFWNFSHLIGE